MLPVAAVVEKSGSFVNWEGRARSFDTSITDSLTRSDLRILSMLADQMGTPINLPTVAAAASEFATLGNWEKRSDFKAMPAGKINVAGDEALLASWRLLLDAGSLQDGEANLAGTAHPSVAVISSERASRLGVNEGELIRVSTKHGAITLPCQISDIEASSVWIPRNSVESRAIATLGIATGPVIVVKA